jgi:pimeloyl-ACP methyl ester carboxylesterase
MITYQRAQVDGQEIFYREAGPKGAPSILLLHGFPTSSHMFRNLIPALSDRYHVVAPDRRDLDSPMLRIENGSTTPLRIWPK